MTLDVEQIVEAASAQTGLSEIGEPDMLAGLEVLIESLNREGNLRDDGAEAQRLAWIGRVANRMRLHDTFTRHPEILEQEIRGPIVIVGLPRTGTSKLHRMMAASPDLQSVALWRILNPAALGPAPPGVEDPRIAIAEQAFAMLKEHHPTVFAGHPMIARDPDEEIWMMDLLVRGFMPHYQATVPAYLAWAREQDDRPWYEFLRKLLQLFQWEDGSSTEPWLLKAPEHLAHLDLLFEAFPDATIVHTHRDPAVAIASIAGLCAANRRIHTDHVIAADAGAFPLEHWSGHMRAYLARRPQLERTQRFVDVPYRQVVADTMAVIERIAATAGLELSDASRAAMLAWEADNPQHKHGKYEYTPEDVGLTEDRIRAAFPEYLQRFGPLL